MDNKKIPVELYCVSDMIFFSRINCLLKKYEQK